MLPLVCVEQVKTSFLIKAIRELLAQQVSLNQVLYINFEDERLLPMSAKECGALFRFFLCNLSRKIMRRSVISF